MTSSFALRQFLEQFCKVILTPSLHSRESGNPFQYLITSTGLSLRYYHPRPGIRLPDNRLINGFLLSQE